MAVKSAFTPMMIRAKRWPILFAVIEAGARHIQGTLNGIGERCGNANLTTIIPTLALKPHYADRFETNISESQGCDLTRISRAFDDILNRSSFPQSAYVGTSAFATKAGIHASALLKTRKPMSMCHLKALVINDA